MAMKDFHDILRQHWGYDDFRGIQLDIIRSIAEGNDTLGLMPTGGGKSITFQVPALALPGMTIVVTPLIALMKDQVNHLIHRGIRAAAIHIGMTHEELLKHLDNAIYGAYKFLYVSPERLTSPLFIAKVRQMNISFITIDEAHCISQWGYDFRPSYLRIADLRDLLPGVPVLALTATATPRVVDDICRQLRFRSEHRRVYRMSFMRPNLRYIVRRCEDKPGQLIHILQSVSGSAIVFTRSRSGTADVARLLNEAGISARHYHAGLPDADKDVRQQAWQTDRVRVIVATNAFGMGIDKPDVRLVIHMELPDSVEAYFQEAGRAGRDGATAYAVLLYNNGDHGKMLRRIPDTFPEKQYVADVYDRLAYFFQLPLGEGEGRTFEFNIGEFCRVFRYFPVPVESALRLLTRAGYIQYREEDEGTSRLLFLVSREDLYHIRLSPDCDTVLRAVLREYGGIFSDYVPIEEKRLAMESSLSPEVVYESLKWLTHLRIIHYVPAKRVPRITYTMRRIDVGRATLPREVYEDRREDYVGRIEAILRYASDEDTCRSRLLLSYFGEEADEDCGRCDVCVERRKAEPPIAPYAAIIRWVLSDGAAHRVTDFPTSGYSEAERNAAFAHLESEEEIILRDGLYLSRQAHRAKT